MWCLTSPTGNAAYHHYCPRSMFAVSLSYFFAWNTAFKATTYRKYFTAALQCHCSNLKVCVQTVHKCVLIECPKIQQSWVHTCCCFVLFYCPFKTLLALCWNNRCVWLHVGTCVLLKLCAKTTCTDVLIDCTISYHGPLAWWFCLTLNIGVWTLTIGSASMEEDGWSWNSVSVSILINGSLADTVASNKIEVKC